MPPREKKTPERGERKTRKKSPKGKEKATVIREQPERNLFLECIQAINQPPTATDPQERRRSTRHSQSTPSPSTQTVSPKGKEECQQTLNQQSTKRSTRFSRSSTPSPTTLAEEDKRRNNSILLKDNQRPGRGTRYTIHTSLQDGKNVNFEEWQVELAAGHTSHAQYHDWLTERIDDNRQLTMEVAAEE